MKLNILILEPHAYSHRAVSVYKTLGPVSIVTHIGKQLTTQQRNIFKKTDVLIVRNMVNLDKEFIDLFPRLKVIGCAMTGDTHIDTTYLQKKHIPLLNLKGQIHLLKDVPAVAEKTMGYIINLSHKLLSAIKSVPEGNWHYKDYIGNQMGGKTIGLIGLGRLGKMVAIRARAFGMRVVATDPHLSKQEMKKSGVQKVSLDTLIRESDVISLHASYVPKNDKMLKEKHFKAMKKNAIYINTSRGELNDEKALYKALKNKWIAGAALDNMNNEGRDARHLKNNPLIEYMKKHDNLLITPHTGGFVREGMEKTEDFIAERILKYAKEHLQ